MASHAGYIAAAFGLTIIIVLAMVALLIVDHRALRRDLARLPARSPEGEA